MSHRISCFISFSGGDTTERDVRFLIQYLEDKLRSKVQFRAYFDQKVGSNLQEFMKKDLIDSSAIIVLLGPDYKRKIDNVITSGVLTEFNRIVDRLDLKENFLFIPIYWRGSSMSDAMPEFFADRDLAIDLHKFRAFGTDGREPYLPDRVEADLRPTIAKLVSDLERHWDEVEPEFAALRAKVNAALMPRSDFTHEPMPVAIASEHEVDGAMFTKQERSSISIQTFSEKLFVKTSAFRSINRYHKSAFTGRKGAGKTTLLKIFKYRNDFKYFSPIDIEVNDWNLHDILGDMTFVSSEGDLSYTALESKVFDFIWPIFLSLCIIRSLQESTGDNIDFNIDAEEFSLRFSRAMGRYDQIFLLSVGFVKWFFQKCIDRASTLSEAEFKSDLMASLNVQNCTEMLLGRGYGSLVETISSDLRNRKILFCLDRFDTEIQKYRKDVKDRHLDEKTRSEWEAREVFWIQGLVEMIDHLRSPDYFSLNQEFYKIFGPIVDFCVPLPRDRLFEVQQRRRDSIVGFIDEEINWNAPELLTMLRKRLQIIWEIDEKYIDKTKYSSARLRYDRVIEISNRRIPRDTTVNINGVNYTIDTFLNILRHTFFRPRDVLIYYTRIIVLIEAARKRKSTISNAAISRVVSEQTKRVVEEEFLGEFVDTIKNIRQIVQRFHASYQLNDFASISKKILTMDFDLYGYGIIQDIGWKIKILYEIGFLGVSSPKVKMGNFKTSDYSFFFIDPQLATSLDKEEIYREISYAIHPVFIEYLSLKMGAHKPVMMLNWQDIEDEDVYE